MRKIIVSFILVPICLAFLSPIYVEAEKAVKKCEMELKQGDSEVLVTLKAHNLKKPYHYRFEIIDTASGEIVESGKTLTAFQEDELMRGFELKKGTFIIRGEITDHRGQVYMCKEKKWEIKN